VTPEASRYLEKARQCLSNAKAALGYGLSNDAGRGAYLTVFHAAQALIFEQTGKVDLAIFLWTPGSLSGLPILEIPG
jgi:uncharacterized protein (UPF0332 family)